VASILDDEVLVFGPFAGLFDRRERRDARPPNPAARAAFDFDHDDARVAAFAVADAHDGHSLIPISEISETPKLQVASPVARRFTGNLPFFYRPELDLLGRLMPYINACHPGMEDTP
jgi:hypothetical protein